MSDRLVIRILIIAIALTILYRLYPVFSGQPALSQLFMTEDGYLMLTIARNMAIGLGMTVSEGTVATNGVQPMATFLFTLPYLLTGGDKVTSLIGIHLIAASAVVGAVFALRAFAARVLELQDKSRVWPWLAAALWAAGPLLLRHTMNGLETGIYTLFVLLTLLQFARVLDVAPGEGLAARLLLGLLCGLTFLARNDGAFLVTSIFAVWALHCLIRQRTGFADMLIRLIPPGLVSLVLAAPWLIYNKLNFGSIVPISGTAQSHSAVFGQNVPYLPTKLFEQMFPMLPIPTSVEHSKIVMLFATAAIVVVLVWFLAGLWRHGNPVKFVVAAYGLHGLALTSYYGLFFGADWFLSRYLSVLAPLMIVAALWVAIDVFRTVLRSSWPKALAVVGLLAVALSVVLLARPFWRGTFDQGHFQVVDWVTQNVDEETWVGAVQTGTLGYWHDRTINLDGKVNPEALAALQSEGNVLRYVADSKIEYVADWEGIADWVVDHPDFGKVFEVVTHVPEANLAVLRRSAR